MAKKDGYGEGWGWLFFLVCVASFGVILGQVHGVSVSGSSTDYVERARGH